MAVDDLVLHHANGTLTLRQAVPPRITETRDVRGLRSPYGSVVHRLGTGKAQPTIVTVQGTVKASSFIVADDALAELEDALPDVSTIEMNGQRIPVMGGGGVLSSTPVLTGWRVTLQFLSHPEAAWVGPTAGSTKWTTDSTQLTADQLGY